MKHLIRWELKQSFRAKVFWGFGIVFTVGNFLMSLLDMTVENEVTGYEAFLRNCNNIYSLFILCIGIYAGIHVAGAFEERRIQAAVMAGNSRLNIVLAKLLSFSMVIAIYTGVAVVLGSIPGFLMAKEAGIDSVRTLILQSIVFIIAEVSFISISFVVSMIVKKLGTAIGVNFAVLLVIYMIAQDLLKKPWGEAVLKFTAAGQVMLTFTYTNNAEFIFSFLVSVFGVLFHAAVAYIIFRKDELK